MSRTHKTEAVGDLKSPVKFSPLRALYDNRKQPQTLSQNGFPSLYKTPLQAKRKRGEQLW